MLFYCFALCFSCSLEGRFAVNMQHTANTKNMRFTVNTVKKSDVDSEHEEHEKSVAHSEDVEHAEHGEHEEHAGQEEQGSVAMNVVHWCFLFFLMFVAVRSLLSKVVFGEEDETMKSYGALVLMVILLYAYEQIPGIAHYHDSAFWGFLKFILKMFTGICLTVIGILGMHEHHEDDEHGHSAAHH